MRRKEGRVGGPRREQLPQLSMGDVGLLSRGAFEDPPPFPRPGDPSSTGGGGQGAREVSPGHPGKPWSLRRSRPCGTGRAFVFHRVPWAAAGRGTGTEPLCVQLREEQGVQIQGWGAGKGRAQERESRAEDGEQRPARAVCALRRGSVQTS